MMKKTKFYLIQKRENIIKRIRNKKPKLHKQNSALVSCAMQVGHFPYTAAFSPLSTPLRLALLAAPLHT